MSFTTLEAAATETDERPAKRLRLHSTAERPRSAEKSRHLLAQPIGNLLVQVAAVNCRDAGLGNLAVLPDEILANIFSELEPHELSRTQGCSRTFFALSRIDSFWKLNYIKRSRGHLTDWRGSWRSTYIHFFSAHSGIVEADIHIDNLYSDVLALPQISAQYDANQIVNSPHFASNIRRVNGQCLQPQDLGNEPLILEHAMENWPALQTAENNGWSLNTISAKYADVYFRAEAVLTTVSSYKQYHDACEMDESPLYLFDPDFVEKTSSSHYSRSLGDDFNVPSAFSDDLFKLFGADRPNYRWLIAGPARSGSTFHQDPTATSAWNAVVTGRKLWICFPPDTTPPGILVSDDMSEVEAPLSLAEWLMNYYQQATAQYGPNARNLSNRSKLLTGICETGEIFYVPSGWWHLVINLESSIAVTQNFVSSYNLAAVLNFLKHRSDQVSGFRSASPRDQPVNVSQASAEYCGEVDDETGGAAGVIFARFCDLLRQHSPDLLQVGLDGLQLLEAERKIEATSARHTKPTIWSKVVNANMEHDSAQLPAQASAPIVFSFSFDIDSDDDAL